jgi:hypothetical protein
MVRKTFFLPSFHMAVLRTAAWAFAAMLYGATCCLATHFRGVDVQYECLNACTTRLQMKVYRDCTGSILLSDTFSISAGPGCVLPSPVSPWSVQVVTEITQLCPGYPTICNTPGATMVSAEELYWYRDYDVCTGTPCVYWIGWETCCRSAAINNLINPSTQGVYVLNTLNTWAGTCNNSPRYTREPYLFGCSGQDYDFHAGANDPDGDSLAYSLGPCMQSPGNQVNYASGCFGYAPFISWNITIDAATGILHLQASPGNAFAGVICIYTEEWRNGALINTYARDFQLSLSSCPGNANPTLTAPFNVTGNATVSGHEIHTRAGNSFCFDIGSADVDPGQGMAMWWTVRPAGASFVDAFNATVSDTVPGTSGAPPTGRFCWTPTDPGIYYLMLHVQDDQCPLLGMDETVVTVHVDSCTVTAASVTFITGDDTLDRCAGQLQDTLAAPGFLTYLWNTGDTTPSIVVDSAGAYWCTVADSMGCLSVDTVDVRENLPDIAGHVLASTALPLVHEKVYLIRHDTVLQALTAIDSILTDSTGHYFFCAVTDSLVFIKAAPDSANYPFEMPTYADTTLYWNNAITFNPQLLSPFVHDFQTLFGANPGGPGFIGGLITQGANKVNAVGDPVPDLVVFLRDRTTGEVLGYRVTDGNGYFSFAGVPLGDYDIVPDKPHVSTSNVPQLSLTAQVPVLDSLDLRLHRTYLEWVVPSGVVPGVPGFHAGISPSPFHGTTTLRLDLTEACYARIRVFDLSGREMGQVVAGTLDAGEHSFALGDGLGTGVYWVELRLGERVTALCMVKHP